ncbi:hypothetical protein OB236_38600 [Paenibacillus sp. WQ 127069]|uniref:Uncharacterized protein n=1 Tax=Paenibacillus baimaensis TaxID=2982185 RepID=A0ABT2UTW2_9BACL|nr:hypothetical protein [Paenibacillus sp. WQ 127069]MCU6798053.1 hypothetical protein [Paenibacillus sp. WQ 127069]
MAALTADVLNKCKVLKANKADERVTKALLECKEAALKLTIALDELELIE